MILIYIVTQLKLNYTVYDVRNLYNRIGRKINLIYKFAHESFKIGFPKESVQNKVIEYEKKYLSNLEH